MPYLYLDDIATTGAAFEARRETLQELFRAASVVTVSVMVADIVTIAREQQRHFSPEADDVDMLSFEMLQEIILYKDA